MDKELVRELRHRTGAGIMECKKALTDTGGDIKKAQDILREKGIAQAIKREMRESKEGRVDSHITEDSRCGVMVELNCETDFVARTDEFAKLAKKIASRTMDIADLWKAEEPPPVIKELVIESISALRENIRVSRVARFKTESPASFIFSYIHPGNRLGVLLEMNCTKPDAVKTAEFTDVAKNIAMQIASMDPLWIDAKDVPGKVIEKEKEIYRNQEKESGKPEKVLDQIAEGRLRKYFSQVCLMCQPYIKEPALNVKKMLAQNSTRAGGDISVVRFVRFKVGEE